MLSEAGKQFLLKVARESSVAAVCDKKLEPLCDIPPELLQPAGAFVTLHEAHELRGCIGYIDPVKLLIETIQEAAVKAALDDPRFLPVSQEELERIEIEISVLSPLQPVTSIDNVKIGTHGLVVEIDSFRGLLLPQVASTQGWNEETFVLQTIRKAGLPLSYRHHKDLKIFLFTAEVFHEHVSTET